jgi:U3 small nucleolar RNA-associated protein 18
MLRLEATWQQKSDKLQEQASTVDEVGDGNEAETQILPFFLSKKSNKRKNEKDLASSSDESDNGEKDDDMKHFDILDEEEENLENLVFGSSSNIVSNIDKLKENKKRISEKKLKSLENGEVDIVTNDKNEKKNDISSMQIDLGLKPVWEDADDSEIVNLKEFSKFSTVVNSNSNQVTSSQIEESLKARYTKYYGTPVWADLELSQKKKKKNDDSEEEEEMSFFQQTGNFLSSSTYKNSVSARTSSLPKTIVDIKTCTDANKEEPHSARLKSVEFHPSARVMLTAGLNQKLTLFQIDGKKNPKIQTVFIEKFPILAAHFTKLSGDEIIMGSRHKSFYYYDMHSGKMINVTPPSKALGEYQERSISTNFEISPDNRLIAFVGSQGQIHLFSCKSKEWIDTLKINGDCHAVTFSADTRYLFAFGADKDVYVFDVQTRGHECIHKFTDFGCLSGTALAVSDNMKYIATGCKSGVVNLYNLSESLKSNGSSRNHPKPLKSFMNLTTPCTSLKFNSTSEILASCSAYTENACKLIHVDSLTVFSNFPLAQQQTSSKTSSNSILTPMRIPQCIDFSLNSGYLTIGNHKGNALLYRLKHYGSF